MSHMAFINPNLDEVVERQPHKPGLAQLMIKDLEIKKSKAGGAYINFQLEPESINGEAPEHNSPIFDMASFQPKAIFGLHAIYVATGLTTMSLKDWAKDFFENVMDYKGDDFEGFKEYVEPQLKDCLIGKSFKSEIYLDTYHNDQTGEDMQSTKLKGKRYLVS